MVYRVLQVSLSERVVLTGLSGSSSNVLSSENIVSVVEKIENIEGVGGIAARASDELTTKVLITDEGASKSERGY